ncbi:MAG: radical SAM protein [Planctomycetes bacterium]|nr:radical SAM protein [Planctomycetota bacterium]
MRSLPSLRARPPAGGVDPAPTNGTGAGAGAAPRQPILAWRHEAFGGIVSVEEPGLLAHVDRDFMRGLGLGESPLWTDSVAVDEGIEAGAKSAPGPAADRLFPALSFPLEVHLAITNRCDQGCGYCYMDSRDPLAGEYSTERMKRVIDLLAERRVFSIAMGGGEAFLRPDLFDLAAYARGKGIIPNLTTSGFHVTEENAARTRVFGQVNVSVDDVDEEYNRTRRHGPFARVDEAISRMLAAGARVGLNTVVHRGNFDHLERVAAYAARRGLADVELLRLKPAGRGARDYQDHRLTPEQGERFFPVILDLMRRHAVALKVDCSFVPFLCSHNPDAALLDRFAVYGCEGANVLLGVKADGRVNGCSFFNDGRSRVDDLPANWRDHPDLTRFRLWRSKAPSPCRECAYLSICKGGCHAVAVHLTGDFFAPDPECPAVIRARRDHAGGD